MAKKKKLNKGQESENIEHGDEVKVITSKEEREGKLLKSPKQGVILIKLGSGYNIGIKKEDVLDIELIEKNSNNIGEVVDEKEELNKNKKNPKIDVIVTGGTISSRIDPSKGGVNSLTSPKELFKFYPEIFDIVQINKVKVPFMKASENMDYVDWKNLAKEIQESLGDKDVEGVIVTHGTDFLHYTSVALSFFLKNVNKPIVLTYSQRSTDRGSSDARLNLQCAARAAISDIAEVILVGHASVNDDFCYALKGTKCRKMHTSRRDAFKPINTRALAKVWPDSVDPILRYNVKSQECKKEDKGVEIDARYNDDVALVKFYPGMNPEFIDYLSNNYEGIVIEASGLGHIATREARKNLLPAIKKAIKNGLVVCMTSQTYYGKLGPQVYSLGRVLSDSGIIFLKDMLPETALVKLGYVLGHKSWKKSTDKIREKMLENMAGEINDRIEE